MEDNKESEIKRVETFQKKDKFSIFKRHNTKSKLSNKIRKSIDESNNNITNNVNRSLFHHDNQGKTHLLMKKFQKQSKMRRFSTISNFMLNKPNNQTENKNNSINNNNDALINNTSILEKLNENKIEEDEDKNDFPKKKPKIFLPEVEFNKIDILKENKIYKHNKNELLKEIDNYYQIKFDIEKMKKNEKILMKELIKAKSSRNEILDDIYKLRNEIEKSDIINSSFIENQKEQNNKEVHNEIENGKSLSPKVTFDNFYINTVNTVQSENEIIEKYIDQYEEKILKTKQDNQTLFENFDELNQEYDLIKDQNEKYKKKLKSLEILIKNTLQEKNELKNIFEESNY
jgi:hypothetical protein